jgi:hypothetical protein
MASVPDEIDLARHRDGSGRGELVARRTVLALIALMAVAALLNVFGQEAKHVSAAGGAASLAVSAPSSVRGGLFFEGRFTIDAHEAIDDAVLVLEHGWLEGLSVNTIEPAAAEEAGGDGRLALSYGPLEAGDRLVVYMQFQVNPTNVGRRNADVTLLDGETPIATVDHTLTVFP